VRDADGRSYVPSADAGILQLVGATAASQSAASTPPETAQTPPLSRLVGHLDAAAAKGAALIARISPCL
jgi:hypothetical protein